MEGDCFDQGQHIRRTASSLSPFPWQVSLARTLAVAKICEKLIFYGDILQKIYNPQDHGRGFLAKGRTRRYDQMCAGESIQINYVFFVVMS